MSSLSKPAEDIELDKVCRSCLSKKGEMRSLFGACLDDMLRKVAQVQVEVRDGLPELMCFQCVLQVSRAFRFKQQCQKSDATLRAYIARLSKIALSGNEDDARPTSVAEYTEVNPEECVFLLQAAVVDDKFDGNVIECSDAIISNPEVNNLPESFELLSEHNLDASFPLREEVPLCDQILGDSIIEHDDNIDEKSFSDHPRQILETSKQIVNDTSKQNGTETFQCNVCLKVFAKKQVLRRHLKIHDPKKPHVCTECGMSFTESSNLTKHKKKHTGELRNVAGKPNLCTVCGKAFKWASSLSKHMNHHTKRKVLNCPHCPKYYLERQTLKLHLRTHTGERPFVCNICEKAFTQMCNLEKHLRTHTGEKPYVCPICDKRFTQSSYIATHMRSHTGEKPYMCNECGKCFAGSNTLAMHKRTHTGERPYCCNICGKTFARLETATVHQRTHTGEKPHYCNICNRSFISSSHLSNHKRAHMNSKVYPCLKCNATFLNSHSLKIHVRSQCAATPPSNVHTEEVTSGDKVFHDTILVYNSTEIGEDVEIEENHQSLESYNHCIEDGLNKSNKNYITSLLFLVHFKEAFFYVFYS